MTSQCVRPWERFGEERERGVAGTALSKLSKVWRKIRTSTPNSPVTDAGCAVDLASDECRDPVVGPRRTLLRWVDRVKTLVTGNDNDERWEFVTWSDSDDEGSGSCCSEDASLTSCGSLFFGSTPRSGSSVGVGVEDSEGSCEGDSWGARLVMEGGSLGCGTHDVRSFKQKLKRGWERVRGGPRRKGIRECAVRSALKRKVSAGTDKRSILRKAVATLLPQERMNMTGM